ncbi:hypothetical protein TNCV_1494861 [Trichonephila clavipes]|nr:hypothetical protein TNCV_1494861 [Trichonephila clavipes]
MGECSGYAHYTHHLISLTIGSLRHLAHADDTNSAPYLVPINSPKPLTHDTLQTMSLLQKTDVLFHSNNSRSLCVKEPNNRSCS